MTFKNFLYDFSFLIELNNNTGGIIEMNNVNFENIDSCGSFISYLKNPALSEHFEKLKEK